MSTATLTTTPTNTPPAAAPPAPPAPPAAPAPAANAGQATTHSINPKLIAPFVNAVRSVFKSMVNVQATVNRPHLKSEPSPAYDVSGIIGFSGEASGSVVVSFQMAAAEKLASAFAGVPITAGTPDFADAIGELANMIAGSAKKDLGAMANISVPNVIIGRNHQLARLSDVPCVVVPCSTPVGDFCVEVNIRKNTPTMRIAGSR